MHFVEPGLTTVSASALSSHGRNEQDAVVPNALLSRKDEISSATVTSMMGKEHGEVRSTSGGRSGVFSALFVTSALELERLLEDNAFWQRLGMRTSCGQGTQKRG